VICASSHWSAVNSVTITLAKPYKGGVEVAIAPGLEAADGASTSTTIVSIVP
jgi:hypothetical protein